MDLKNNINNLCSEFEFDLYHSDFIKEFAYSRIDHFNYFRKKNTDKILFKTKLDHFRSDIKMYQNMLIYNFVIENLKPGTQILELGNSFSPVSNILNSKGYKVSCLGFNFTESVNNDKKFIDVEWILKSEKGLQINDFPKDSFDFSFSISAFVQVPELVDCHKLLLDKVKYYLKPLKNSLFCTLNVININNVVWHNNFFEYLHENSHTINESFNADRILSDKNLYILSEDYFKNNWKDKTNMTYEKDGKQFSFSVFWINSDILNKFNFEEFTYSKESHFDLFESVGISLSLYGKLITKKERSIKKYRSMLLFSYLIHNVKKKSNVLIVGKIDDAVYLKLKYEYNFYFINDIEILTNSILNSKYKEFSNITDALNNNLNFFPLKYFDFIFSGDAFFDKIFNEIELKRLESNIFTLLSDFGTALFSFTKYFSKNSILNYELANFLFKSIESSNKFVQYDDILSDNDLYAEISENQDKHLKDKGMNTKDICYNILWEYKPILPIVTKIKAFESLQKRPAYVFHHLMKCGGTSVVHALINWFELIFEHNDAPKGLYKDINDYNRYKLNMCNISGDFCIVAHFQNDGNFLHQRYPEVLERSEEFKVFTFVRDPLELLISMYYYGRKDIEGSLEKYINGFSNFIANLFPCDESNYKEIIDRYFFVGIVENLQDSFDKLADLTGKKRVRLPFINKSEKDEQVLKLSKGFIEKFKKNNSLDYLIYDYCYTKFSNILITLYFILI